MKQYTAIYSTETLKNIQYAFQAVDGNMAKMFCHQKFNTTDIIIRDEDTGEEFPLIDEWLSDSAYVSKDMASNIKYILYIYDETYKEFFPIVSVSKELLEEKKEDGWYQMNKSTHKCGNWYVGFEKSNVEGHEYICKDYCEKHGHLVFVSL